MKTCGSIAAVAGVLLLSDTCVAQSLDINFSTDSLYVDVDGTFRSPKMRDARYNIGYLYHDDTFNNTLGFLGVSAMRDLRELAPGLSAGGGARLYVGDVAGFDVAALPIDLTVGYALPQNNRVSMVGNFQFAPGILAFNDSDKFTASSLRVGYEYLPEMQFYVEYRDVLVDLTNDRKKRVDAGWQLGVRLPL